MRSYILESVEELVNEPEWLTDATPLFNDANTLAVNISLREECDEKTDFRGEKCSWLADRGIVEKGKNWVPKEIKKGFPTWL